MRTVILRAVENYGDVGLIIKGMRVMEDYPMAAHEGELIAHDLLEHQNGVKSIGSIDDELEALGGLWFVRGQHGTIRRNSIHTAVTSIASDISNLGRIFAEGVDFRTPVPNTYSHDYDEDFNDIISEGYKATKREFNDEEPMSRDTRKRLREYRSAALHYLRRGFNKAKKRYNNDSYTAYSMFWNIADAVHPYAKNCDYEGQEFRLRYSTSEAYCDEYDPDEY